MRFVHTILQVVYSVLVAIDISSTMENSSLSLCIIPLHKQYIFWWQATSRLQWSTAHWTTCLEPRHVCWCNNTVKHARLEMKPYCAMAAIASIRKDKKSKITAHIKIIVWLSICQRILLKWIWSVFCERSRTIAITIFLLHLTECIRQAGSRKFHWNDFVCKCCSNLTKTFRADLKALLG